jgi:ubiquinone/menaquinone biosynthesis C-methylase UbiE
LEALEICGCLDALRLGGRLHLKEFFDDPKTKQYDTTAITNVCEYLYAIGLFDKIANAYTLTESGKDICLNRHGYFHFVQAYGPIFYELPKILMGEKKYGRDVEREDVFVAKATAEVSEWLPLPAVRLLIRQHGFERILDLGCGSGELLLSLAPKANGAMLRGVDLARASIAAGLQTIEEAGLSNRISLKVGDITKPEMFSEWLKASDVLTIMFVLHEFLDKGEQFIVDLLRELKTRAGKDIHFLIAETAQQEPAEIRKRPTSVAEHHLFHALSNQGVMKADQFRDIVRRAGLNIMEDLYFKSFAQHYILAK